jgi:hypothetical protein
MNQSQEPVEVLMLGPLGAAKHVARASDERCPGCKNLDTGPCAGPLCNECGNCEWNCGCA